MSGDPSRSLGRYTIHAELGKGGFATVYRATDTVLERDVALKILKPGWTDDAKAVERFMREARQASRLKHANIVTIYDVGQAEGRLFIAMELVRGRSLQQIITEDGALPWTRVLAILEQSAAALDYAHAEGLVHRDIKPANIILDESKPGSAAHVMLTDFGLVRGAEQASLSMGTTGGLLGTPEYIPPEIWDGEIATKAGDIYALGCVAFYLLTGRVLFSATTPMAVLKRHAEGPVFPQQWPGGVPGGVDAVLRRALAKDPNQRPASAAELAADLRACEGQATREKATREKAAREQEARDQAARQKEEAERAAQVALAAEAARRAEEERTRQEAERNAKEDAERKAREEQERQRQADLAAQAAAAEKAKQEADERERQRQAREAARLAEEEVRRKELAASQQKTLEEQERQRQAEQKRKEEEERAAQAAIAAESAPKAHDERFASNVTLTRQASSSRLWWFLILGGGAVVTVVIILILLSPPAPAGTLDGMVSYSNLSRDHSEAPQHYPQTPPVGGVHSSVWQNCGIYDQPVRNENAVHSLEHGAVWLAYQPDLPASAVETLRSLARGHDHILLAPYPDLPHAVVATAWGLQLPVEDASDPRLSVFVSRYEKGPQMPEPGAVCTGGIGTPIAN